MNRADLAAMDAEANAFAMELLMPFDWIVRDAANLDLCDDDAVARLAKRYRVPASVMAVRIGEVRAELAADDRRAFRGDRTTPDASQEAPKSLSSARTPAEPKKPVGDGCDNSENEHG